MKHAIMILGSGTNFDVVQKTITHFDDSDIDFFIHWDLKYELPKFMAKKSQIYFVKPRIKVYWGTSTGIFAEQKLLKRVFLCKRKYDYIHLISSSDIPLMTKDYFKNYFKKNLYLGYMPNSEKYTRRLSFYYPIDHFSVRNKWRLIRLIEKLNILFHINRLKGFNVTLEKGPNWFSMRSSFLPLILKYKNMNIFKHSFLGDELYIQTILSSYRPEVLKNDNEMAARYIDWKRGNPYTFTKSDLTELKKQIDTKFAFARKVNDASLIDSLFENY